MSMSCLDCHDYMNGYNQGKKEGTIEELEDIKASIKRFMLNINPNSSESDYACNYILNEIIQNRISKLKGDNNESE